MRSDSPQPIAPLTPPPSIHDETAFDRPAVKLASPSTSKSRDATLTKPVAAGYNSVMAGYVPNFPAVLRINTNLSKNTAKDMAQPPSPPLSAAAPFSCPFPYPPTTLLMPPLPPSSHVRLTGADILSSFLAAAESQSAGKTTRLSVSGNLGARGYARAGSVVRCKLSDPSKGKGVGGMHARQLVERVKEVKRGERGNVAGAPYFVARH
ncbi:hypothetical protein HK101_004420 [Irineochytrium annulatum]|nr:hypothetical protein HK101_004420 [Irineochytrium annulatum]